MVSAGRNFTSYRHLCFEECSDLQYKAVKNLRQTSFLALVMIVEPLKSFLTLVISLNQTYFVTLAFTKAFRKSLKPCNCLNLSTKEVSINFVDH